MSTPRDYKMYLVKVWGQKGLYTTQLQVAPGWHGGDFAVDKVHYHKIEELNNTSCAWAILGVIEDYVEGTMHMLPVVDGWVYDLKGNKLRAA